VIDVAERHGPRGPPGCNLPVDVLRVLLAEEQQHRLSSPSREPRNRRSPERRRGASRRSPAPEHLDLVRLPQTPSKLPAHGAPSGPTEFAQQAMDVLACARPRQPTRSAFETPLLAGLLSGLHRAGREALAEQEHGERAGGSRQKRVAREPQLQDVSRNRRRSAERTADRPHGALRYGAIG